MEPTTRRTLPACEPCASRTDGQTLFGLVTFTHGWRHVHGGGQPPVDELCTLCPEVATTWVVGDFSPAGLALLKRGGQRPLVQAPCPDELTDVADVGDGYDTVAMGMGPDYSPGQIRKMIGAVPNDVRGEVIHFHDIAEEAMDRLWDGE